MTTLSGIWKANIDIVLAPFIVVNDS